MSEVRTLGVEKIEISAIAGDGGVGTAFAALGVTYKDTAELTQEDPVTTEHKSEESDEPEEVVVEKGPTTIKWSIINCDPDTLVSVLGGEATGTAPNKIWSAPDAAANIEKSIKITPKAGMVITIVRAKLTAKLNYKIARTGILQVDIVAKVLKPTKSATAAMTLSPKPA